MAQWTQAWITGASSGIGRELALQLARSGVTVAVSARSREALASLAASHANIHAYPLDVTDDAAVIQTVQAIERAHGPIDLAVLNAGIWQPVKVQELQVQPFAEAMAVNYLGVVRGLAAIVPGMIARGSGQIALVSSVAGYRGLPRGGAYVASKAALIGLAECLYPELREKGVALSLVNPGFVKTPMTDRNDFPMPFIIGVEDAAARIIRGLKAKRFEIAFPLRLVMLLKLGRVLPYRLYFWLIRRMYGR
jgi:short-subunit dehydrogenase